jgi:hypothetical protein
MSIVVLQLPDVKRKSKTRPQKCPYCQGVTFQGWVRCASQCGVTAIAACRRIATVAAIADAPFDKLRAGSFATIPRAWIKRIKPSGCAIRLPCCGYWA